MQPKTRLVAELDVAVALAREGHHDAAAERLRRVARDPDVAALGPATKLGLPRKLHSAWLRLAKAQGDRAAINGFQATAVPPDVLFEGLFSVDPGKRRTLIEAQTRPVPKVLHQVWIGDRPPVTCGVWSKYAARHGWEYHLWTEHALDLAGITSDPMWRQMMAEGDLPGAVDIARYHILWNEGGLYLDCDWHPAREDIAPEEFIPSYGLSAIAEPQPRLIANASFMLSNALIAVPAGHPALQHLLAAVPPLAERLPGAPAWWLTGPLPFTLAARQGPVTILGCELIAGQIDRGRPLSDVETLTRKIEEEARAGFLIAWKSW